MAPTTNKKKIKSLFDRRMADKNFRDRFEKEYPMFQLEVQILNALEKKGWSYSRLATELGTKKSNVSRDLTSSSIRRATIPRISRMAQVLDYDFVPLLIPAKKKAEIFSEIQKLLTSCASQL